MGTQGAGSHQLCLHQVLDPPVNPGSGMKSPVSPRGALALHTPVWTGEGFSHVLDFRQTFDLREVPVAPGLNSPEAQEAAEPLPQPLHPSPTTRPRLSPGGGG